VTTAPVSQKTRVFLRVSKETISRITDKVIDEMNDWEPEKPPL
jgi:hypothetical protein